MVSLLCTPSFRRLCGDSHLAHFADGKSEAQKSSTACPTSCSWDLHPSLSASKALNADCYTASPLRPPVIVTVPKCGERLRQAAGEWSVQIWEGFLAEVTSSKAFKDALDLDTWEGSGIPSGVEEEPPNHQGVLL